MALDGQWRRAGIRDGFGQLFATSRAEQRNRSTVNRYARGYTIIGGLVLTALVLLLTELVVPESGFFIDGWGTWTGVILIVWAANIAYGEVDKKAPEPRA